MLSLPLIHHSSEDSSEDDQPVYQLQKAAHMNNGNQLVDLQEDAEEDIRNAKLQTLKELFPQRSDQDLLQVIILFFLFILITIL